MNASTRLVAPLLLLVLGLACGGDGGEATDPGPADPGPTDLPDVAGDPGTGDPGAGDVADVPVPMDVPTDTALDTPADTPVPTDPGTDPAPGDVPGDPGTDAPALTCCHQDYDCAPDQRCAKGPQYYDMGMCRPAVSGGGCWSPQDCAVDEVCAGMVPCPCDLHFTGTECGSPGHCAKKLPGCCRTDGECPAGQVCAPGNTCQPAVAPGKCWTQADCYETQQCTGATFCPCGAICGVGTFPGTCTPLPSGCCYDDTGCPEGQVCTGTSWGHTPGHCVPSHLGPACPGDFACCWHDDDCPGGYCQGATACGCIELCPACGACAPDQMGTCRSFGIQVDASITGGKCDRDSMPEPLFTRYVLGLAWHTSLPAKSAIQFTLNAFTGQEGSVSVEEGYLQDHAMDLSLTHMHLGTTPKVGDTIVLRILAEGEAGQKGLSKTLTVPVDQELRDCLYPFDPACSDGSAVICRALPPPCDTDKVTAAIGGCQRCVYPKTCTCDDGEPAVCTMVPPDCDGTRIRAVQGGCFVCVSPLTCNAGAR